MWFGKHFIYYQIHRPDLVQLRVANCLQHCANVRWLVGGYKVQSGSRAPEYAARLIGKTRWPVKPSFTEPVRNGGFLLLCGLFLECNDPYTAAIGMRDELLKLRRI